MNRICYRLHRERVIFLAAVSFLTRINVSKLRYCDQRLAASVSYFPVVGLLVGAIGAVVYVLAQHVWMDAIAVVLAMAAMIITTGGFHEDGAADTADGFGGGWTIERKLDIMKDSRLGTYGSLTLIMLLLIKFAALQSMQGSQVVIVLLFAHALARWSALPLLIGNHYVSASGSRPGLVGRDFSQRRFWLAAVLAWLPILLWQLPEGLLLLLIVVLVLYAWQWWCRQQIGGITGDTLGAANQWVEVVVYLFFAALPLP